MCAHSIVYCSSARAFVYVCVHARSVCVCVCVCAPSSCSCSYTCMRVLCVHLCVGVCTCKGCASVCANRKPWTHTPLRAPAPHRVRACALTAEISAHSPAAPAVSTASLRARRRRGQETSKFSHASYVARLDPSCVSHGHHCHVVHCFLR